MNNDERLFIFAPNYSEFLQVCKKLGRNRLSYNTIYLSDRVKLFGYHDVLVYFHEDCWHRLDYDEIKEYLNVIGYRSAN